MTPFWLPKLVAIVAGAIFIFATEASRRLKVAVAATVLLSLVLQHGGDTLATWAAGLVLQTAVAVFVLIYFNGVR